MVSALIAFVHMTAENRSAAVLDSMKNADLIGVQQMAVFFKELTSMSADYISHLAGWPPGHGVVWSGTIRASRGLTVLCR